VSRASRGSSAISPSSSPSYARLRPDLFTPRDLATIDVSLSASDAVPSALAPENGHEMATEEPAPFRIP
jgi:hypothetical protein